MKILFLTYQGGLAGSSLSISYLARGLAERGHEVWVGCPADAWLAGYFEGSSVKVVPLTFRGRFDTGNARHIASLVKTHQIDIINAQSSLDRYTSMLAVKLFRAPAKLVYTRRQVSRSMGGPQSWLYQWAADKIVAVSEGIRKSLLDDGIRNEHIAVIYNGTPASKYAQVDMDQVQAIRDRLNITEQDFVVGCVSRLKQQAQILQAIAKINEPLTVVFVGISEIPGIEIDPLLQMGHRIIFEGRLRAGDILPYYKIFNVKVLASTMEGLSQSLLESMYMKVPVIATAAAGNLDLVRDGSNGLLFEDGDIDGIANALDRIRKDQALRDQLISNGFITASVDFSIENTLNGYEELFQKLARAD